MGGFSSLCVGEIRPASQWIQLAMSPCQLLTSSSTPTIPPAFPALQLTVVTFIPRVCAPGCPPSLSWQCSELSRAQKISLQ